MDALSALLIAFFGFLLGLVTTLITAFIGIIATWITTRINKSTDIRAELLHNIDDWVHDCSGFCYYAYWKLETSELGDSDIFVEYSKKVDIRRWVGVAKALHQENIIIGLNQLQSAILDYMVIVGEIHLGKKHADNRGTEITNTHTLQDLTTQAEIIDSISEEIHRLIAEELIRILPSWLERVWNRIWKKV